MNTTTQAVAPWNGSFQAERINAASAGRQARPDRSSSATPAITGATTTTELVATSAPAPKSTDPGAAPAEPTVEPTVTTEIAQPTTLEAAGVTSVPTCTITFAVDLGPLTDAGAEAVQFLDSVTPNLSLAVGSEDGPADVTISYGGEWPEGRAPLGWTSADRRQILLNPDHPYAAEPAIVREIVSHELGHVFIGPHHVTDGSLLDPSLNGQVMLNDSDRAALSTLTCADLGYG